MRVRVRVCVCVRADITYPALSAPTDVSSLPPEARIDYYKDSLRQALPERMGLVDMKAMADLIRKIVEAAKLVTSLPPPTKICPFNFNSFSFLVI